MSRQVSGIILFSILFHFSLSTFAQEESISNKRRKEQYIILNKVLGNIPASVNGIPYNINKIAFFDFQTNLATEYTKIADLKYQVENKLIEGGMKLYSIPELEKSKITRVAGNDSGIKISNQSSVNYYKDNAEELLALANKYGINGLLDATVINDSNSVYHIQLRIISVATREVVWVRSIKSEELGNARINDFEFEAGLGFQTVDVYDAFSNPNKYLDFYSYSPYYGNIKVDQYVNSDYSLKFGYNLGLEYHYLKPVLNKFDTLKHSPYNLVPSLGVRIEKGFISKHSSVPSYWICYGIGTSISYYNATVGSVKQVIKLNITHSFGFSFFLQYYFSKPTILSNHILLEYKDLNYGFNFTFRLN